MMVPCPTLALGRGSARGFGVVLPGCVRSANAAAGAPAGAPAGVEDDAPDDLSDDAPDDLPDDAPEDDTVALAPPFAVPALAAAA